MILTQSTDSNSITHGDRHIFQTKLSINILVYYIVRVKQFNRSVDMRNDLEQTKTIKCVQSIFSKDVLDIQRHGVIDEHGVEKRVTELKNN